MNKPQLAQMRPMTATPKNGPPRAAQKFNPADQLAKAKALRNYKRKPKAPGVDGDGY